MDAAGARLVFEISGAEPVEVPLPAGGDGGAGSLESRVSMREDGFSWSISNSGVSGVSLESVSLVWTVGEAGKRIAVFRNGHQSWSRTGLAILGRDPDPSTHPDSIDLARETFHADPRVSRKAELRSELVTVIDAGMGGPLICLGFEGGREHDGTFRIRRTAGGEVEVAAEAYLGGSVLEPGEERELHSVFIDQGRTAPEMLEGWASRFGRASGARVSSPYRVGWCSWYQYFHDIDEEAVRSNLGLAGDRNLEIFQIDDGYQPEVGDWLETNRKFHWTLENLASEIRKAGLLPGIWIAPFLASPSSKFALSRPRLLAGSLHEDAPLPGAFNLGWGGMVHTLDTTSDEALEYLEGLAGDLVSAGFRYLKLDFTYAPSLRGRFADPSKTPAERVRAGLEAIRRGAGDETFLLGCGCPLGPAAGIVDGMRIGPDVAPWWGPGNNQFVAPGYEEEAPATQNAWRNTLARSFMHRRLWINDPDCLMLRTTNTQLSPARARAWAMAVAASGGMAVVSDDLSLLAEDAFALLEEVVEIGRSVDLAAQTKHPPRCEDLMDATVPARLLSPAGSFRDGIFVPASGGD